jgi:hypothetical protein
MAALLAALAGGAGCSHSSTDDEGKGVVVTPDESIDTSKKGIETFLEAKTYQSWCKEGYSHISTGPHPNRVRTFWNQTLFNSLTAGNQTHPKGSIALKELYEDADGTQLIGQAVAIKVGDDASAESWIWFEGHLPNYDNPYYGLGLPTCQNCHTLAPRDHVWGYGQACF